MAELKVEAPGFSSAELDTSVEVTEAGLISYLVINQNARFNVVGLQWGVGGTWEQWQRAPEEIAQNCGESEDPASCYRQGRGKVAGTIPCDRGIQHRYIVKDKNTGKLYPTVGRGVNWPCAHAPAWGYLEPR
jgi:hypothetical protein